ncbi:hypothetical protein CQW23_31443 [Capsicum baccatum]|uniref:TPX2 C-terminal domain-containing protein n=1 Tax=Capsicum baccatum TaxID=33114 RepID=A0A2G2V7M3_CAPBA|nr:hypothetical protein CQW23_31443 [Capsicum baccatum]
MNSFSGTIPPEIGNLTNLIYLNMSSIQISGTVPSQIDSTAKLQILYTADNQLNGSIPGEIGKEEAKIKQLWRNLNFKATPMPTFYREPDHRSEKTKVSSGSKANVLNQHKSTEEQPIARKVVASRASSTEKVSHRLYQSVNRDKESANSCQPIVKQNGSSFRFKTEEQAKKRKEARTNFLCLLDKEKKEAEIKQLRRNLNFKATLMPAFYSEPGRHLEKNKDGQSWEEAGARAAKGLELLLATENTVRCLRAEVYNRCSTNERLNVANSPQVSEVTIHPSAELSDSSVPSTATSKTSKQTQSNGTVSPKREQGKRQVANSPRPRTSDSIRRNKDFKDEDKTKVLTRRTGNHATRKDVRSVDLSHSTRVGRLTVGVASWMYHRLVVAVGVDLLIFSA